MILAGEPKDVRPVGRSRLQSQHAEKQEHRPPPELPATRSSNLAGLRTLDSEACALPTAEFPAATVRHGTARLGSAFIAIHLWIW